MLGAQVLDHLVGVQHVVAHLVAPRAGDVAAELVELGALLGLLHRQQLGLEDRHRGGLVLQLGALVLAGDDDAGRQVGQADRRVGGVDALAARAAGAVDVDADLVVGDLDLVGLLDDGHHLDGGERRLPAALVVERADPDQPVGARLDGQRPVGVRRLDGEGGRLDAGLLGVGGVVDLGGVAVPLGPAQVHPHQHLGEVGGVDATGARADGDERLARVVLTGEQRAHLERLDGLAERNLVSACLGEGVFVVLRLCEFDQDGEVVEAGAQAGDAVVLGLQDGQAAGHPLRIGLVVPQVGHRDFFAQLGDLGPHPVEVEHGLDAAEDGAELA